VCLCRQISPFSSCGVNGKELDQGPHIHYISSAWGHERSKVVKQVEAGDYSLNMDNHIPIICGERGERTLWLSAFIFKVFGSGDGVGAPNFPPHDLGEYDVQR
jgi:hypothetical protein